MSWVNLHSQPLSRQHLAHLFRRASFGASPSDLSVHRGKTAETLVSAWVRTPAANPPTDASQKTYHDIPYGYPEFETADRNTLNSQRIGGLKQWWLGLMMQPERGLVEKMTLFWQNHFVVSAQDVPDVRYLYRYLEVLRRHALGNFRALVIEMAQEPAMLRYLNGNANTSNKPNENFARELMELFTMGPGNYTESDVQAAARVLTGWQDVNYRVVYLPEIGTAFKPTLHDTKDKAFSSYFKNKVIKGRTGDDAGPKELEELIGMILEQPETARFMVRKLYRWLVTADITAEVERYFIQPLADDFRQNYEIGTLVQKILTSQHFFDPAVQGAQIKSPMELSIGTLRLLGQPVPSATADRQTYDALLTNLLQRTKAMEMEVMGQPSVFGWRPYYDTGFYKLWISGTTLGLRGDLTDRYVNGSTSQGILTDPVALVEGLSAPGDPEQMVDELWELMMAVPLPEAQRTILLDDVLMVGAPRYEWTGQWVDYQGNKTNKNKYNAIRKRIVTLLTYMLRLAEYQLG